MVSPDASPPPPQVQRWAAYKCNGTQCCDSGWCTTQLYPDLCLTASHQLGGTPNLRSGTKAYGQISAAPPNYSGSATPAVCGGLQPMYLIQRASHTGPPSRRTSQRSCFNPPITPAGTIISPIYFALYGGSGPHHASNFCKSTASWQGTWRYPTSRGPGQEPITQYLRLADQYWHIDGGALDPPPSCSFICWCVLLSVSTRVHTYHTACTGGGVLCPR